MAAEVRQSAGSADAAGQIAEVVLFPVRVAQRILPDRGLPMYLGLGALAVTGLVEWPIAAATGLGYAALVRWNRPTPPSAPEEL